MPLKDPIARKTYQKNHYDKNKEKYYAMQKERYKANAQQYLKKNLEYRRKNREKTIWRRIRDRAKLENIDFNLDVEDIVIPELCPVLNIKMFEGKGRQHDASPSVDRINPKKGYIKGNIVIISFLANRIKSNATAEQVEAVARWMKK